MYRPFHFSFRSFVSSVSFSSPFQYIRSTVLQCVIVAALFPRPSPPSPSENPTCVYKQAALWYYVAGAACTTYVGCCTDGTHRCNGIGSTYKVTFHALFPVAGPARTTIAPGVPLIYKRKGRDRVAYIRLIYTINIPNVNERSKRSFPRRNEACSYVNNYNRR